jgi:hypothetical protein
MDLGKLGGQCSLGGRLNRWIPARNGWSGRRLRRIQFRHSGGKRVLSLGLRGGIRHGHHRCLGCVQFLLFGFERGQRGSLARRGVHWPARLLGFLNDPFEPGQLLVVDFALTSKRLHLGFETGGIQTTFPGVDLRNSLTQHDLVLRGCAIGRHLSGGGWNG